MKRTIFIFCQYITPPDIPGGHKRFELACELVRKGNEVYIFSSNFNHMSKNNVRQFSERYCIEKVDGVNFVWMNTFEYFHNNWRRAVNMAVYGFKSYRISLELAQRGVHPDVIIGTVAHVFSVASAYFVCKTLKSRFFIEIGDLWPEVFATSGKMSKTNPVYILLKKLMSYFYNRAEKIICLTDDTVSYFRNTGYGSKAILVPFGIKPKIEVSSETSLKPEHGFKVIYAGSFQPIYPLDKVIEAAKLIECYGMGNIKFILMGNGVLKENLKALTKELNVKNVEFLDPLPKRDLVGFLKSASALILIEKKASYGFPNKLIDYLAAGRPIIYASDVRHNILNSGCCVEASCADPEDIALSVIRIANRSKNELERMASHAREYLHANHNIEIITDRFVEHIL